MNVSLNDLVMNVTVTSNNGVVNKDTIFRFSQNDSVITASYSGGKIVTGYLIGKIIESNLHFRFIQIDLANNIDSGQSVCEIKKTDDGRIQLVEHFEWDSINGKGINIIEQIFD